MSKPLTTVLALLATLVAGLLIFAGTRPDTFRIQRSMTVDAPAEKIVPLIHDFRKWSAWSPFEKLDPAMRRSYSGAAKGEGAVYEWQGNDKAGAGRMEVLETSSSRVAIQLDFLKPFQAHNTAEFTLEPQGDSTRVTWAMHGPSPYLSRLMGVFLDMDQMIGKEFEAGLASLKGVAEG